MAVSASQLSLFAAIAIMMVWGANFAITKYVLDAIGVGPFLFIRFLTLPLLGFALLALVYRRHLAKSLPLRADWPRFVAAGLIGHTVHVGIVIWGINLSTAFSSSLVLTSGPLFTLLILVLLGAERLQPPQVAGTLAINGVEQPISFDIEAQLDGTTLNVHGSTSFVWADFDLQPPNTPSVQVQDRVAVEVLLVSRAQAG